MASQDTYREDLAYIHDVGFDRYVLSALPGILDILKPHPEGDLILDLGCGTVEVESWLRHAGFDVATSDSYGLFKLPPHHRAFVACKPAS